MIGETSLLTSVLKSLLDKVEGKFLDKALKKMDPDRINEKFKSTIKKVSKNIQNSHPDILGGSIDSFFQRKEVIDELFKLLYILSDVDTQKIEEHFDTQTLPPHFIQSFINALKKELQEDREFNTILSNKQVHKNIKELTKNTEYIPHILTLLEKEYHARSEYINRKQEEFYKNYKQAIFNSFKHIYFIGLDLDISMKKSKRLTKDIFVKPVFRIAKNIKNGIDKFPIQETVFYDNFLYSYSRSVVLGEPGAGKSLLIKAIVNDLFLKEKDHIMPFVIELRKYSQFKKQNKGNLLEYLVLALKEYNITPFSIEELLVIIQQKECFLFFDGLDEIFDITDKIAVSRDIENLGIQLPHTRILVTSRIIGYEEASLDSDIFTSLTIEQFNDKQVEDYLVKWYRHEEENDTIREKEIANFLKEKQKVDPKIIQNPLLLSLIVIIYTNTSKLPESKLEIYQSCTKTLIDKWELSKNLTISLSPQMIENKEKIFSSLAHWQYEQLSNRRQINHMQVENFISEYLWKKLQIGDEYTAHDLAKEFLQYAEKRSIYFDNNFTHKTFLEYYTAYWIYCNIERKHAIKERDELISKRITSSFWKIVLELLFYLIDREQGDTEVMDNILSHQIKKSIHSIPFIIDVLPQLVNVSKQQRSETIIMSIHYLMNVNENYSDPNNPSYPIFEALQEVSYPKHKLWESIRECFIEIEDSPDTNLSTFYSLYIDIVSEKYHPLSFVYRLANENTFEQIVRSERSLFLKYVFARSTGKDLISEMIEYITLFGFEYVYDKQTKELDELFERLFRLSIEKQLKRKRLQQLGNNLNRMKAHGLKPEWVFRNVKMNYYEFDLVLMDNVIAIIDELETTTDANVRKFITTAIQYTHMVNNEELKQRITAIKNEKMKKKIYKKFKFSSPLFPG